MSTGRTSLAKLLCLAVTAGTVGFLSASDFPFDVRTSHEPGSTHSANLPLSVVIVDQAGRLKAETISLFFDGDDVTHGASIRPTAIGATVSFPLNLVPNTQHSYLIQITNVWMSQRTFTFSADFSTDLRGRGDFVIECEDFDYDRGKWKPATSLPRYRGLAYEGLGGVFNVDFKITDDESGTGDNYRRGESPNVMLLASTDRERSGYLIAGSWLLSVQPGGWFNYTRNFPTNFYEVYAALSHGETNDGLLSGELFSVDAPPGEDSVATSLGLFRGAGSGAWGFNAFVPLTELGGTEPLILPFGGIQTVRFQSWSGTADYLLFVPTKRLKFTQIVREGDSVTIHWIGNGQLYSSSNIDGPYEQVPDAVKSPATILIGSGDLFFGLAPPEYGEGETNR